MELVDKISGLENKSCLALTEAKKCRLQNITKEIEKELQVIQEKKQSPQTVDDLLGNSVIVVAFPNIRKLLLLYLLVPQSEASIQRGFHV